LENEVKERKLENVKLLGYQARELMPQVNASSDVGTIPMKATTTSDTFPSKIYTILACAKPAIVSTDLDSELAWVIQQSRCGRIVPPDDPQAYTDAIFKAFQERSSLPAEGERGRKFVEQEYSKEVVAEKYDRLIKSLVGE
jgi:glycosyltransferase involved in cell wall biosynthesis